MYIFLRLLQKVQGKAQSAPATDSGKGADRIYRLCEQF
jgi:hypothetical protein